AQHQSKVCASELQMVCANRRSRPVSSVRSPTDLLKQKFPKYDRVQLTIQQTLKRLRKPAAARQRLPSVLFAEAFSFSGAFSSDLADVAFWSLFWPSPVWVDFEPFESLSPDVAACFETFESFSLPLTPFSSRDLVSALESSPSSKRLP